MIPCKECLILPVCKNRRTIRCKLLFKYLYPAYVKQAILESPRHHHRKYLRDWRLIDLLKFFDRGTALYHIKVVGELDEVELKW
jgi:hypothetical protein